MKRIWRRLFPACTTSLAWASYTGERKMQLGAAVCLRLQKEELWEKQFRPYLSVPDPHPTFKVGPLL